MKLNWTKLAAWQKGAIVGVILALIISVVNVGVIGFGVVSTSAIGTVFIFIVAGGIIGALVDKK